MRGGAPSCCGLPHHHHHHHDGEHAASQPQPEASTSSSQQQQLQQAPPGEREFVRYWLHNGFVNVDSEKMSKSLGNFFTIRDVSADGRAGPPHLRKRLTPTISPGGQATAHPFHAVASPLPNSFPSSPPALSPRLRAARACAGAPGVPRAGAALVPGLHALPRARQLQQPRAGRGQRPPLLRLPGAGRRARRAAAGAHAARCDGCKAASPLAAIRLPSRVLSRAQPSLAGPLRQVPSGSTQGAGPPPARNHDGPAPCARRICSGGRGVPGAGRGGGVRCAAGRPQQPRRAGRAVSAAQGHQRPAHHQGRAQAPRPVRRGGALFALLLGVLLRRILELRVRARALCSPAQVGAAPGAGDVDRARAVPAGAAGRARGVGWAIRVPPRLCGAQGSAAGHAGRDAAAVPAARGPDGGVRAGADPGAGPSDGHQRPPAARQLCTSPRWTAVCCVCAHPAQARADARAAKDFASADAVRIKLASQGVAIMDTPQGTTWRPLQGAAA